MSNASPAASSIEVAEHAVARPVVHVEQQRVTAARKQAEERRLERVRREVQRRDVAVEMVDGGEREPPRPRKCLGDREPDEQRTYKAGSLRHRHRFDVVQLCPRLLERGSNDRRDELQMTARGDLGHDASVPRVQIRLRGDDVREHLPLGRHERRGGLVARRLDAEDHPASACSAASWAATGSRHMIKASSRLSV